jgi:two-component system LytT family sensor kinase
MALRPIKQSVKAPPYWLVIASACVIPAVVNAFTAYINSRVGDGSANWGDIVFAGGDWLIFGLLTPIAYVLAHRYPPGRKKIAQTVIAHSTGALLLCVGWASLGFLLAALLNHSPARGGDLRINYLFYTLGTLPWGTFLYLLVLGCVYAFTYHREAREREEQESRLAAQLAEARLGALRMQLNPHFLFNSLNAITVLVRDKNTRDASKMLELLSDVLRQVLQSETRQEVTLNEELQFLERYLAIEQVRFSDKLQVRFTIEPEVGDALVPEFILQPLVENAVRHGVAKLAEGGVIQIAARADDSYLVITIRDNGPGYYPKSDAGVGIANTCARLETLFGDEAEIRVANDEKVGTIATVRLPFRKITDS